MSHDHHGGGGGGGAGGLQATNMHLAESYWYLIAGATGLAAVCRGVNWLEGRRRLNRLNTESVAHPTQPTSFLTQAWATSTALVREASHPRLFVPWKGLRWTSPPPLGRTLLLLAYWAVVIYMAAGHGAIADDIYFYERLGFRNAWVTMMQMPLLFLLAMKAANPIALLTGTSHERLNWLHRWVGRTMFVTATIHGFHFWTQWLRADFVELQMLILPQTKEGLGAWAVLLWTLCSTMKPFRQLAYEVFIVQHLLSYVFFIWLVYVHVPRVALPYLWFSVACLCFDRLVRWGLLAWQNLRAKPDRSNCKGMKRFGHQVQVHAAGGSTTVLTMKDVPFTWRPGQHLYLWMPRLGPLEAHPYTIACAHKLPGTCTCNSIQLVVRRHGGFSKRLHNHALKLQEAGKNDTMTAFVLGPFGTPPRWDIYETMILISASTGASFTLPILEAIVQSPPSKSCVKRVEFVLMACQGEEIDFYLQRLREAIAKAQATGLELTVHIAVTRSEGGASNVTSVLYEGATQSTSTPASSCCCSAAAATRSQSTPTCHKSAPRDEDAIAPSDDHIAAPEKSPFTPSDVEKAPGGEQGLKSSSSSATSATTSLGFVKEYSARPDIESLIRGPVEASGGETSVVVCGGGSLTTTVRNCVSSLSDERAVHKGTGAQGIHLFVEEYSF